MAYDKLIDSAKLDAAMNATADAIRGKTGGSADIPWNESTGFASAIAAIASGGSQVATGSFLYSNHDQAGNITDHNNRHWTITGLGFTPLAVIIYADPSNELNTGTVLYAIRSGDYSYCVSSRIETYEEETEDGETYSWEEYQIRRDYYNYSTGDESQFLSRIYLNDDGFKLDLNINLALEWGVPYKYIAISREV